MLSVITGFIWLVSRDSTIVPLVSICSHVGKPTGTKCLGERDRPGRGVAGSSLCSACCTCPYLLPTSIQTNLLGAVLHRNSCGLDDP